MRTSIHLFYFIICFVFVNNWAIAQQHKIDSLKSQLSKKLHDTDRVNTLNVLSEKLLRQGNYDTALIFAKKTKTLAKKINFKKGILESYNNIGLIYETKGDFSDALKNYFAALKTAEILGDNLWVARFYNRIGGIYNSQGNSSVALKKHVAALKIAESLGDKKEMAACYYSIGLVYVGLGNFPDALANNFTSLNIAEALGDKERIARLFLSMGSVYRRQNNYPNALKNYFASLKMFEALDDKRNITKCYGNIALVYLDQENYADALKTNFAALEIMEKLGNKMDIATTYHNMAMIYVLQSNYQAALKNYFACLPLFEEMGNLAGITSTLNNIGYVYLKQGKIPEAKKQALLSLKMSKEMGLKEDVCFSYNTLSFCDSALGNWKGAYEYHKLYKAWSDSVYNNTNAEKIAEMSAKYNSEKKDQELLLKDKNIELLEKDRQVKNYLLFGLSLILVLTGIIVFLWFKNYKQKQKEVKLKNVLLEQKLLRLQMNPHFIFNSLSSISAEMSENVPKARDYLAKFARLMRLVLENSRESYVAMKSEVDSLNYYLLLQQQQFNDTFDFEISIDHNIPIESIEIPPMLIQPHIENAILHGVNPGDKKGMIRVRFQKETDTIIRCDIEDNGVGRKKSRDKEKINTEHKSLALEITQERLKTLGEESHQALNFKIEDLEDEHNNPLGTLVSLTLPYR